MLSGYVCADGEEVKLEECLRECRLKEQYECGRCMSLRMLKRMSEQREWKGKPSVTQLLNGTREEYLKLTRGYAVSPQTMVAAYFGSVRHAVLEGDDERYLCEKRLSDPTETYTGQFDCYDKEEQILYDTKTYGSYKLAQIMGIKKEMEVVADPLTGEVTRTATGRVKKRARYEIGVRSMRDVTLQLNAYRIMLEKEGYPVKGMRVEVIVRDGGTWIAKDRGIKENAMMLKVNRLPDKHVQKYLLTKAQRLIEAVKARRMPPPCRAYESWGGQKCRSYCPVRKYCEGI